MTAFLFSCVSQEPKLSDAYLSDLDQWKSERMAGLKKPLGYLSMVGLYWLKEGNNTFGTGKDNDIIMPDGLPDNLGQFIKDGDNVTAKFSQSDINVDGQNTETINLIPDTQEGYNKMNWQSYYWYLIKRGNRYGIRVKDTLADMRLHTASLPYFSPNRALIINADYILPSANESTSIKNHVGDTYQREIKGRLRFRHDEKDYELIATSAGDNVLFVVFGDDTNGDETYGGGRFLYIDIPADGEQAILDFNKAENPICALNDFGTCPYPSAQNILDFAVTAGERKVR